MHIRRLLLQGMETKGYTCAALLRASGLECDVTSLNRKLHGLQALEAHEGRTLAAVLDVKLPGIDRLVELADRLGCRASWAAKRRVAS